MSQLGNLISANLQFTPGGNPLLGAMGGVGGLAGQYAQSYNSALNANQANYNNIIQGYQTVMNNVGNTLGQGGGWGVAAPAAQAIGDVYAKQSGGAMQNSINRGLGQTTAATAAQRGAGLDAQKAYAGLGANLAQTYAGYEANLGQGQLGFMGSVQSPYPDAGAYNQLYGIQAGYAQAQADRQLMQQQAAASRLFSSGGGGGGVIGAGGSPGVRPTNTGGSQQLQGYDQPGLTTYRPPGGTIAGTVGLGGTMQGYSGTGRQVGGPTYPTYDASSVGSGDLLGGIGNIGGSLLGNIYGGLSGAISGLGDTFGFGGSSGSLDPSAYEGI